MRRLLRGLFEIAWKTATAFLKISAYDPPSTQEIADARIGRARRIAQVSANPTDRNLARALIRTSDMPYGMSEIWRSWTPLDPSGPMVVSVQQSLQRRRRFRRRADIQLLLELRRYLNDEAAIEAMASAPSRVMADGQRMRRRTAVDEDMQVFDWTERREGQVVQSMLELHLRRGSATALLRTASKEPSREWERQMIELARSVGERLR